MIMGLKKMMRVYMEYGYSCHYLVIPILQFYKFLLEDCHSTSARSISTFFVCLDKWTIANHLASRLRQIEWEQVHIYCFVIVLNKTKDQGRLWYPVCFQSQGSILIAQRFLGQPAKKFLRYYQLMLLRNVHYYC